MMAGNTTNTKGKAAATNTNGTGPGPQAQIGPVSTPDLLRTAPCTDYGNAQCLERLYGDELRYCHTRQTWLIWDNWRWRVDTDGRPRRMALMVSQKRYHAAYRINDTRKRDQLIKWTSDSENFGRIESGLRLATSLQPFATSIDQWDTNPDLLATPTGTVDLRTGQLHPARQSDYISLGTSVPYNPNADCPPLAAVSTPDLRGRSRPDCFHPAGDWAQLDRAGKRTSIVPVDRARCKRQNYATGQNVTLGGDFHAASSFDAFDANERNAKRDDLAALVGKRLLTIVESDEDRRLSGAKLKSVTGSDPISCRHLFGKYFTYTPIFKPWFATNFKPMITDDTEGMWRRVRLIPFLYSFAGSPDRHLSEKLDTELPGILAWAVEGARIWYAQGLGSCKAVDAATADYRKDSDILGQWIDECCKLGPQEEMDAGTGYHSYKVWAQTNGYYTHGNNVMSAQAWGRRMGERPGISKQRRRYYGISC